MFRVVTPPIIRSTHKCKYSIWHWPNRLCCRPLLWRSWNWKLKLKVETESWNWKLELKVETESWNFPTFLFQLLHESGRQHRWFDQCQMLQLQLCVLLMMGGFTTRNMYNSLQKYNKLYIVASFWTIIDVYSIECHFLLHSYQESKGVKVTDI